MITRRSLGKQAAAGAVAALGMVGAAGAAMATSGQVSGAGGGFTASLSPSLVQDVMGAMYPCIFGGDRCPNTCEHEGRCLYDVTA